MVLTMTKHKTGEGEVLRAVLSAGAECRRPRLFTQHSELSTQHYELTK